MNRRPRDLALFNLAIDSKLRGCDLVRLQVRDVVHCTGRMGPAETRDASHEVRGGSRFQNGDHRKHVAMLYDLVSMPWPPNYQVRDYGQGDLYLAYYVGWYLPAALTGKLLGFKAALAASFVWTLIGLGLVLCWIFNLIRRVSVGAVLIFVFFSGLDFFGHILVNQQVPGATDHLEWWSGIWSFQSNTCLLYWVPQHARAGWLMTFVFLKLWQLGRNEFLFFLLAPVLLWLPFVVLGLLPLAMVGSFSNRPRPALNGINTVVSLLLGSVFCAFLLAKLPDPYAEFIRVSDHERLFFPAFWLFLLLEIGLFLLFILDELTDRRCHMNQALWRSVVFLVIILCFRYGMYNDLSMRASIPALTIICFALIRHFYSPVARSRLIDNILVLLLFVGALNPMQEIVRSLVAFDSPGFAAQHVPNFEMKFARQYVAPVESLFFTYLAGASSPEIIGLDDETANELERQGILIR
ncbi:MAG: hypothetical protein LJE70_12275 [Chromatiaceae bacterium]|nr:hypothetical protein [Chromatiaceae bacterium]